MTERYKSTPGRVWPLIAVPLVIFSLGLGIAYLDLFSDYREYVRPNNLPEAVIRSGQTGKQLRMLLKFEPPEGLQIAGFDSTLRPEDLPSSTALEAEVLQSGLPIISIVANPDDLLDQRSGIVANYSKRGLGWERPAYASYFRDGELILATGAGLRVHGGRSRESSLKSFRLHFKELYGSPSVSRALFFNGSDEPLSSIVVHNDVRKRHARRAGERDIDWHYVNPMAYEMARHIGSITPDTQPVQFYLNGVYQGPYVLKERIWEDFLNSRFGHDDFFLADMKPGSGTMLKMGSQRETNEVLNWPLEAAAPLSIAEVEKKVNLDNLTNWFISILFAGTTDPHQGAVARDRSDPDGRWFWINWDMDHSFMDLYGQVANAWEIDNFTGRNRIIGSSQARAVIFDRLRQESPKYRAVFLSRLIEVLNHELTPEFLNDLIGRYETIARAHRIENLDYLEFLRAYVSNRPAALREQMDTYFFSGPSFKLTVNSSPSMSLKIDGRHIGDRYTGWYFADTPARIEISDPADMGRLSWVVNGSVLEPGGSQLDLSLSSDTSVELRPID